MKVYVGIGVQDWIDSYGQTIDWIPEPQIHPTEYPALVQSLRQRDAKVACNNPYVLDYCNPHEIYVVGKDGTPKPLVTHPECLRWAHEMKPGEFWSTVGDNWEPIDTTLTNLEVNSDTQKSVSSPKHP